jgi:hypothetical protein
MKSKIFQTQDISNSCQEISNLTYFMIVQDIPNLHKSRASYFEILLQFNMKIPEGFG